jgi:hypothetical protein
MARVSKHVTLSSDSIRDSGHASGDARHQRNGFQLPFPRSRFSNPELATRNPELFFPPTHDLRSSSSDSRLTTHDSRSSDPDLNYPGIPARPAGFFL